MTPVNSPWGERDEGLLWRQFSRANWVSEGALYRWLAFVLLVCMGCTRFATAASPETAALSPAHILRRVSPHYPAKAIERGQEGWVDVRFTITPEGTTSDIRVDAQYPRGGVFERAAEIAVSKWVYTPRTENGLSVPQPDNHAVLSFALTDSSRIRDQLLPAFAAASTRVRDGDWIGAQRVVRELGMVQGLNLYELGVLEQLRGRLAFGLRDYQIATDCLSRSLSITARFSPQMREGISQMLVMAAINSRQYERAIEAFDAWNPPDNPRTRELRRIIEGLRAGRTLDPRFEMNPLQPHRP